MFLCAYAVKISNQKSQIPNKKRLPKIEAAFYCINQ